MTVRAEEIDQLLEVASQFLPRGQIPAIQEYGNGNINQTYLVTPKSGLGEPFLLQKLNTTVFQRPDLVMRNIRSVIAHVERRITEIRPSGGRRWNVLNVLLTGKGSDHWQTTDGAYWRALSFIGGSHTVDTVRSPGQAREVGFALGTFHALLCDLPPEELSDTLPGFHVTPGYLARFDEIDRAPSLRSSEEEWCVRFITQHRNWAPLLERAREQGILRIRPIHGDPKVNNILFDDLSSEAIAMVDLDTVKPGLAQYDIGDCLRSSCNPAGEEAELWQNVRFDLVLGRAVLEGYLAVARGFFDAADFDFVPESTRLIAFELGLRFFTDHLAGDVYFSVSRHGQNLSRALVQFKLAQSIDDGLDELRGIVTALR